MLWKALEQPYNFVLLHGNSQTAHNGYKFCISRTAIPRTLCLKSKIVDLGWFWNKKLKILKISITVLEGETKQQNLNNNFQNFDSKLYFISSLHYNMSFVDLSNQYVGNRDNFVQVSISGLQRVSNQESKVEVLEMLIIHIS